MAPNSAPGASPESSVLRRGRGMTGLRTAKLSRLLSVTTSAVDRMVLTVQVRFLAAILPHVGTNPCRALGVEGVPVIDFGPHLRSPTGSVRPGEAALSPTPTLTMC